MSNLRETKKKIKSIHNAQKTTSAMKFVSTAKLKKIEEATKGSRVYAQKIDKISSGISFQVNKIAHNEEDSRSVLFHKKDQVKNVDLIFITADRGLYDSFSIKTLKAVSELLREYEEKSINVRLRVTGRAGIEYFNSQEIEFLEKYLGLSSSLGYDKACPIIQAAVDGYLNGIADEVVLTHNGYRSMITQELKTPRLIPVEPEQVEGDSNSLLELEPEDTDFLGDLTEIYFEYSMYYVLIDSLAAEHSMRMQAMNNATNNARARAKQLNLAYNGARQEFITIELIEIISGIESVRW